MEKKLKNHPMNIVKEKDSDLFNQIAETAKLAFKDGEISGKNKLLIALAIDAALHAENGVKALAAKALEAGATKGEILETLRIVNYICGVGATFTAASALEEIL
jgi:alkylhydroperoxidase/carboxymuconolactone decarboxylase family protein YurZ